MIEMRRNRKSKTKHWLCSTQLEKKLGHWPLTELACTAFYLLFGNCEQRVFFRLHIWEVFSPIKLVYNTRFTAILIFLNIFSISESYHFSFPACLYVYLVYCYVAPSPPAPPPPPPIVFFRKSVASKNFLSTYIRQKQNFSQSLKYTPSQQYHDFLKSNSICLQIVNINLHKWPMSKKFFTQGIISIFLIIAINKIILSELRHRENDSSVTSAPPKRRTHSYEAQISLKAPLPLVWYVVNCPFWMKDGKSMDEVYLMTT